MPEPAKEKAEAKARVKEAARRLFMEKGLEGARVREIAEAAQTNAAMVNYYFRSKEALYEEVMEEAMHRFTSEIWGIMNDDLPLQVKIWKYVDRKTDILLENPGLPYFVVSVINQDPERARRMIGFAQRMHPDAPLARQLREEAEKGAIRPVGLHDFFLTMLGQTVYPFLAAPIFIHEQGMGQEAFRQMMLARKKTVPKMICDYLFAAPQ